MTRRIKTQEQARAVRGELRMVHAELMEGSMSLELRERAELLTHLLEDFEVRQLLFKSLTSGDVLWAEIERHGWTQVEAGRELGLTKQRVTEILQGKRPIPRRVGARLVELGARPELVLKGLLVKGKRQQGDT